MFGIVANLTSCNVSRSHHTHNTFVMVSHNILLRILHMSVFFLAQNNLSPFKGKAVQAVKTLHLYWLFHT